VKKLYSSTISDEAFTPSSDHTGENNITVTNGVVIKKLTETELTILKRSFPR
jgi:hypothetical protein